MALSTRSFKVGDRVSLKVNVSGKPFTIEWADALGTVTKNYGDGMLLVKTDPLHGKIPFGVGSAALLGSECACSIFDVTKIADTDVLE